MDVLRYKAAFEGRSSHAGFSFEDNPGDCIVEKPLCKTYKNGARECPGCQSRFPWRNRKGVIYELPDNSDGDLDERDQTSP